MTNKVRILITFDIEPPEELFGQFCMLYFCIFLLLVPIFHDVLFLGGLHDALFIGQISGL